MSDELFDKYFNRLIGSEGGWSDDPKDPGNWTGGRVNVGKLKGTKYGLAANTYPDLDIKNLTLKAAKEIYYRDWWLKIGADQIHPGLVYQVWSFAINAGMGTSRRCMQKAAGVAADGQFGPKSIAAVMEMSETDMIMRFTAERIRHYTNLSTWSTYGKGWMNRVADELYFGAEDS